MTDPLRVDGTPAARRQSSTRRAAAERYLLRPALILWCLAVVALTFLALRQSLVPIASAASGAHLLLSYVLIRGADQRLCLTSLFVFIWNLMFTVRLLQISFGPSPATDHPIVISASDSAISRVWLMTTLAFAAFALGVSLAKRLVPRGRLKEVVLSRPRVVLLFIVFLGSYFILALTSSNSGLLVNIAELYLFAIAFAAHQSASRGKPFGIELLAVVISCLAAILIGFKEVAVLPVIAWTIGHFSAGRRLVTLATVGVSLVGLLFYIGIQSQRVATLFGERTDFVGATMQGLTDYDYPTGLRRDKTGFEIPLNALAAVTSRARGADSLLVLHERVPDSVGFTDGRTLWQPVISSVPGLSRLVTPEYSQLSLGRYFNQTFWSLRPAQDVSSQPLTVPGDFFLNFGAGGMVVGLAVVGFLFALIDRRCPVRSATSAGLFAYAAIPLLSIERNVAYLLVTGLVRYSLGLILITVLSNVVLHGAPGRRRGYEGSNNNLSGIYGAEPVGMAPR